MLGRSLLAAFIFIITVISAAWLAQSRVNQAGQQGFMKEAYTNWIGHYQRALKFMNPITGVPIYPDAPGYSLLLV